MRTIRVFLGLIFLALSGSAIADTILYTVDDLGGGRWQYNYTVENTGTNSLDAFAVFFDLGVYDNLVVESTADDWFSEVFQPDEFLPDDGILESYLDFLFPIAPGETLSGWSVSFDYLLSGTPGEQFFEFFDGFTFDFISDGFTERAAVAVPEPATWGLLAAGMFLLVTMRRRKLARAIRSQ